MKIVYHEGFTQQFHIEVYTNVDWAGNKETYKSNLAYATILAGCSVSLSSKKQTTIA